MAKMFPEFVSKGINNVIDAVASREFHTFQPVFLNWKEAKEHFIHPADWPVCERGAEIFGPKKDERTYTIRERIKIADRVNSVNITLYSLNFKLPDTPTIELPDGPFIESLVQWAYHHKEVYDKWALVKGLIRAFEASEQPLSVLKELWPDFDMLFKLHSGDTKTCQWVSDTWPGVRRARNVSFPVPDVMDHLEVVRSAVLAMSLLPSEGWERPVGTMRMFFSGPTPNIKMPWSDWYASNHGHHAAAGVYSDLIIRNYWR